MRWPFGRRPEHTGGRHSSLDTNGRRRGAYTVEIPDEGTGHYIFDGSDSCSIHSRRLEAWCDVEDLATARDELHWHCLMLSQLGIQADEIRKMAYPLIDSREKKLAAEKEGDLEASMAPVEGTVNSAPQRVQGEQEERAQAERHEEELRAEARHRNEKLDGIRERFEALSRRERVPITFKLVVSVSISFTIFDVGVLGNAFELLAGHWYWKVILTAGVALAPLSITIGIAQWISAAELPLREGVKATSVAIVAGALCITGIGLIVLFRAATTGEPPLPWSAYLFLAFIQSALAMAETMLYIVYFDSRVGAALLERIETTEEEIEKIDERAVGEHRRAASAQARIGEIEHKAKEAQSQLDQREPQLATVRNSFEGEAGTLKGIVDAAILEGVVAARRAEERKSREAREPRTEPAPSAVPALIGGMAVVIVVLGASTAGVF